MVFSKDILSVYFILGSQNVPGKDPIGILKQALEGGITAFQFREKGKGAVVGREKFELAERMQTLCKSYDVPFIINDDVDLAISLKADGLHIGQDDQALADVKEKLADLNMFIGVSARTKEEAQAAIDGGADYIGAGPIHVTSTKHDAKSPIGIDGIKSLKNEIGSFPLVAIGGIQLEDVLPLREAGADGVSVISEISASDDPKESAQQLCNQFK
ncbi:thiamine-phosphate diphosphorylase [Pelagirhabdus alkalitolerans]|uniref:Thiamine-phosphate synthase n=1 Tax=Pelagirhabdus alkalitolerans TaxID=1612202 RepID=A0A1G6JKF5_9BACI|nr:thiamine phosphate synthase [Pelagirhabdus alkalitolerans]SDC19252.1 thiamine-phosphate diphosphorylase [Pelagirhabdus alkalitolerans]